MTEEEKLLAEQQALKANLEGVENATDAAATAGTDTATGTQEPAKKEVTAVSNGTGSSSTVSDKNAESTTTGTDNRSSRTTSNTATATTGTSQKVVSNGYTQTKNPETKITRTYSGLTTPEGQEYAAQLKKSVYEANGLDPNGDIDRNDRKRIGELLGFDPEVYRKEQEARERLERFKKKEAGWRNALGVIGDIVTAGHGGNVYERKADTVAKDAAKAEQEAHDNITNIGSAINTAIAARKKAANEEIAKRLDNYAQKMSYQVTNTEGGGTNRVNDNGVVTLENNKTSQSGTTSTTNSTNTTRRQTVSSANTTSNTNTTNNKEVKTVTLENKGAGGAGNSWNGIAMNEKNSYIVKLNVNDTEGNPYESYAIRVPKTIGESYVKSIYNRMLEMAQENPEIKNYLIAQDMVEEKGDGILTFRPNFDFKQAMAAGWVLDDQFILNEMTKIAKGGLDNGQITQEQYNDIITNIQRVSVAPAAEKKGFNIVEWFMDFFKPSQSTESAPAKQASPAKRGRAMSDKEAEAANTTVTRNTTR